MFCPVSSRFHASRFTWPLACGKLNQWAFYPNIFNFPPPICFSGLNIAANIHRPRSMPAEASAVSWPRMAPGDYAFCKLARNCVFLALNEVRPCIFCCCSLLPNCLPGKYCQPGCVKWGRNSVLAILPCELATSADVGAAVPDATGKCPKFALIGADCCLRPYCLISFACTSFVILWK